MKVAVIQFPGSNCDQDALWALRDDMGGEAEYVWHDETSLSGFDAVFVPGGFSYGDYLRSGAIAARSPILETVKDFAASGRPVLGVCNGFQVLCEAGLLPGALLANRDEKFICQDVLLRAENRTTRWTKNADRLLRIPIAHGEGRYVLSDDQLAEVNAKGLAAFRYVDASGATSADANVNGSVDSIAGVVNEKGNVLGMMPHPERAAKSSFSYGDGIAILQGLLAS